MKRVLKATFFILIVVGIIAGLSIWQLPWLQTKLGLIGGVEDQALSKKAAELALQEGELWLSQQRIKPTAVTSCEQPPCLVWGKTSLQTDLSTMKDDWWNIQGRPYSKKIAGVKTQARYIIEEEKFVPEELKTDDLSQARGYFYYHITAKGYGKSDASQTIVESIYSVKFR